jgi:glycine/D-amino acid oxidase-like deaminating enzyme
MTERWRDRVAVIGAGPIGLAAAAHLVARGQTPTVFEAGAAVGAHVLKWSHVQVFSPWRFNVDPVAAAMLKADEWKEPDPDALPTGAEIVAEYLRPLAALPGIAPTCGSARAWSRSRAPGSTS